MDMKSFAIVVVCYNRVDGVSQLLASLNRANYEGRNDITLICSIDNSGDDKVENFARNFDWKYGEKIIRTFPQRQGLKSHILQCGAYTTEYDIVTVLEDDIIVSESFYSYAYKAAEYYWDDENIAGISLYSFQKNWLKWALRFEPMKGKYDTFFIKVAQSWGQIWTKPKWDDFMKWYESNKEFVKSDNIPQYLNNWPESSWLKFHDRYCIENNKYFVYPYYALSTNTSAKGEHANISSNDYQVDMQYDKQEYYFQPFSNDAIRYDEYFNREGLAKYIGISESQLCVDLYGTRKINDNCRYLLTTAQVKNATIIDKYRLFMRPIESSIIIGIKGEGIYLYDIQGIRRTEIKKEFSYELLKYEMRTHDWKTMFGFSVRLLCEKVLNKLKRK